MVAVDLINYLSVYLFVLYLCIYMLVDPCGHQSRQHRDIKFNLVTS